MEKGKGLQSDASAILDTVNRRKRWEEVSPQQGLDCG